MTSAATLPWDPIIVAPLLVLWLYLPGYLSNTTAMLGGKWIPDRTGITVYPIDGGKIHSDGNRLLGDGKTWNGLLGGCIGGGLICMLTHALAAGNGMYNSGPFLDPLGAYTSSSEDIQNSWFWIGGEWGASFIMGFILGLGCMIGDSVGSFVKRRRGLKREGEVSSKAPLLDTLPFAIFTFIFGLLFLSPAIAGDTVLVKGMVILLILTPIIHRSFNVMGYKLGLKSVPY
ncbi:MAG: CDP-archaeol synthase [Euryarchaeota archaeon]|jgi:CDP-2,3-bis-(O-geranylgeranyl)-sn-glycerol synthase|nr:CDP-archaeol synthase [Euryarchaeota archaeon]